MDRRSDGTYIKKGPWTAEEDEILMNFVNKYGPRDWSSIRSKGLLPRTGKSCRLRWVNKLRPNLKTCKFMAEEERVVIELQAQFGNKWAKIATYLPGRTDNDVKNFWSTRRKRLERMLKNPSPKWQRNNKGKNSDPVHDQLPFLEVPESGSIPVEESPSFGAESEDLKMLPLPNLVLSPSFPDLGATSLPALDATLILQDPHNYPFALLPPQPQLDITLLPECSGLAAEPGHDYFFDKFDSMGASKSGSDHSILTSELQLVAEGNVAGRREGQEMENPSTPDSFFDDFPADMFDYLEPLPSPSEW